MVLTVAACIAKDWDHAPVKVEKISDLVLDWSLYPRKEVDQQVVGAYAKALDAGSVFPTLKVGLFRGRKIVLDGFHRVGSRKLKKIDYADCSELPFTSEAELFAEAVRLNAGHGKGFTESELKANVKRLWKFKFKVDEIQALVHVPAAEIRRDAAEPIAKLTTPCGRTINVSPAAAAAEDLAHFKNALVLCCRWAETGKIPTKDPAVKELVVRCRASLGKVRFNA